MVQRLIDDNASADFGVYLHQLEPDQNRKKHGSARALYDRAHDRKQVGCHMLNSNEEGAFLQGAFLEGAFLD